MTELALNVPKIMLLTKNANIKVIKINFEQNSLSEKNGSKMKIRTPGLQLSHFWKVLKRKNLIFKRRKN